MSDTEINERAARIAAKNERLFANHACTIAACARAGMKNGFSFKLIGVKRIEREEFVFAPEKTLFGEKSRVIEGAEKWFRHSYNKQRLCNIKVVLPEAPAEDEADPESAGLGLACLYEDGRAALFAPEWSYNAQTDKWSVAYRESPCDPALAKARFPNVSQELREALTALCDFCADIGAQDDTGLLLCGIDELDGREAAWELASGEEFHQTRIPVQRLPKLSEKSAHIYRAASRTPVYGGTWYHGILAKAQECGGEEQLRELMLRLWNAQRGAMLFTVNES